MRRFWRWSAWGTVAWGTVAWGSVAWGSVASTAAGVVLAVGPAAPSWRTVDAVLPPTRYVALGDSYASGEGVRPFLPDSDRPAPENRCHRSTYAYSRLVEGPAVPALRESWACSGARIADFYPGQGQWDEPGQLDRLGDDVGLVTLSVGGNDLQFALVLGSCLLTRRCDRTLAGPAALLLRHTEGRLADLYREVLRRAGRAEVFVVGYPRFVAAVPGPWCRLQGLDPFEARWLADRTAAFDAVAARVVTGIGNPRLHYVSTLRAFAGGEACSARSTYVHQVVVRHPVFSFHPTRAGQAILAREVTAAVATVAGVGR